MGLFALFMLISTSPAAAAEPALSWSPPQTVATENIIDIDCPSPTLCVAVDEDGNVLTSTSPAGAWSAASISGTKLSSVSCSSSSLCVAVSSGVCGPGNVCPTVIETTLYTSTNPTGGAAAWTPTTINGANDYLGAVACTTGLCAALDIEGRIITSTDPTGGTSAWNVADVQGSSNLFISAIDCPSSTLCVAVGSEPHNLGGGFFVQENVVLTASDPTAGVAAWTKSYIGFRSFIRAVSCPTTTFCLAVDKYGYAWSSGDPTGGQAAWKESFIDPSEELTDVSCATASFCAAVDQGGGVLTSTEPTGGEGSWGRLVVGNLSGGVSCPSSTLCVAAGEGNVSVGTPRAPVQPVIGGQPVATSPSSVQPIPVPPGLFMPPTALKVKRGKIKVPLTCIGKGACSGTIRALVPPGAMGSRRKIASVRFWMDQNSSRRIGVPLTRFGKTLFEAKKQLRAEIRIGGKFGSGEPLSLNRVVTLKLRR